MFDGKGILSEKLKRKQLVSLLLTLDMHFHSVATGQTPAQSKQLRNLSEQR